MTDTRSVLLDRKEQALARRRDLVDQHAALRKQMWDVAAQVGAVSSEIVEIDAMLAAAEALQAKRNLPTIMDAVVEVLADHKDGMTALEILAEINAKYFGGKIIRSSLSPQLSRLKDRHKKIGLDGNKWFLLPQEPTLPLERRI